MMGILAILQSINEPHFYFHELLSISYLFQFFYNHLYYGLGWESSFRYFVIYHLKVKNILYLYIFMNFLCFIFSVILLKLVSFTIWPIISFDILNIVIVYLVIPNLLFVFIFPLLTTYMDLFSSKGGLVINKFYAYLLLVIAIIIPALLQYLWLNFTYSPELITISAIILCAIVVFKFQQIVIFWENRLLQTNPEQY
jgi:hypothetical protein